MQSSEPIIGKQLPNLYPGYLSGILLAALYCERGKKPEILSVQYHPLIHPDPIFIGQTFKKHTTFFDSKTSIEETSPYKIRSTTISEYLQQILFPFYAYQQMIHKYDHSGMIVMEFRVDQKLSDIIPNYKLGAKINFSTDSVLTVAYLKNGKQCDFFLQCCGMKATQRADTLMATKAIAESYDHEYFPVCLFSPADGYSSNFCLRKPNNFTSIEVEGKLFENNLFKSGLWTCQALNVYLFDKHVFALDIYGAINMKSFCKPKNPKCMLCNITKWNQQRMKKATPKLRKCKKCQLAFYCSRKCQKYHWKYKHRNNCWKHRGNLHCVLGDKLENR
eukprot:478779_1